MRMNKGIAGNIAASLTLFLAILTGMGLAMSPAATESSPMSFSVDLKEWFVLEVQTPEAVLKSDGAKGANVTATMSPDGGPALVKALTAVAGNQAVELRVQVFGDLIGPSGETLPLSEVSWEGTGDGFLSGQFTSMGNGVLARWTGPGFHEGAVRYFSPKTELSETKYTQRIVYSLMAI
jgi:hypothetical protein